MAWPWGNDSILPPDAVCCPPAEAARPAIPILSEGQAGDLGQEPQQLDILPWEHQIAFKPHEGSDKYRDADHEYGPARPADIRDLTAYGIWVAGDAMHPKPEKDPPVVASPLEQLCSGDLTVVKNKKMMPICSRQSIPLKEM